MTNTNIDYEFNEFKYDITAILSLLGAKKDLLDGIRAIKDPNFIESSLKHLIESYYTELSESVKDRLVNVSDTV